MRKFIFLQGLGCLMIMASGLNIFASGNPAPETLEKGLSSDIQNEGSILGEGGVLLEADIKREDIENLCDPLGSSKYEDTGQQVAALPCTIDCNDKSNKSTEKKVQSKKNEKSETKGKGRNLNKADEGLRNKAISSGYKPITGKNGVDKKVDEHVSKSKKSEKSSEVPSKGGKKKSNSALFKKGDVEKSEIQSVVQRGNSKSDADIKAKKSVSKKGDDTQNTVVAQGKEKIDMDVKKKHVKNINALMIPYKGSNESFSKFAETIGLESIQGESKSGETFLYLKKVEREIKDKESIRIKNYKVQFDVLDEYERLDKEAVDKYLIERASEIRKYRLAFILYDIRGEMDLYDEEVQMGLKRNLMNWIETVKKINFDCNILFGFDVSGLDEIEMKKRANIACNMLTHVENIFMDGHPNMTIQFLDAVAIPLCGGGMINGVIDTVEYRPAYGISMGSCVVQ